MAPCRTARLVSSERITLPSASMKLRPKDITSPTDFIVVVRVASAPGNFSKGGACSDVWNRWAEPNGRARGDIRNRAAKTNDGACGGILKSAVSKVSSGFSMTRPARRRLRRCDGVCGVVSTWWLRWSSQARGVLSTRRSRRRNGTCRVVPTRRSRRRSRACDVIHAWRSRRGRRACSIAVRVDDDVDGVGLAMYLPTWRLRWSGQTCGVLPTRQWRRRNGTRGVVPTRRLCRRDRTRGVVPTRRSRWRGWACG